LAFKPNEKFLITHLADGNSMASPTQTVVGKNTPNPLIAEGLLKNLKDLIPPSPPKFLTNFHLWNGRTTKSCNCFPSI